MVLLALIATGLVTSARADDAPAAAITLSRTEVASGGTVEARLWFTGAAAAAVHDACVSVATPSWIVPSLKTPPAAGKTPQASGCPDNGGFGPFTGAGPFTLELKIGADVAEGTTNLEFFVRYVPAAGANPQPAGASPQRYALIEKPLVVGLFGTGAVAGLPLTLASLAIPGLFGVFLLRVTKSAWWDALNGAAEKVGGGLLLSLVAIWLWGKLAPLLSAGETAAGGVSFGKLAAEVVVGLVIAFVLRLIEMLCMGIYGKIADVITNKARATADALVILDGDSFSQAVVKTIRALCETARKNPAVLDLPKQVVLPDGRRAVGASIGPAAGDGMLIGWAELPAESQAAAMLRDVYRSPSLQGQIAQLLKVAEEISRSGELKVAQMIRYDSDAAPSDRLRLPSTTLVGDADDRMRELINPDLTGLPLVVR